MRSEALAFVGEGERVVDWLHFFPPKTRIVALPSWRRPKILVQHGAAAWRWRASALYPGFRLGGRMMRAVQRIAILCGVGEVRRATHHRWSLPPFVEGVIPAVQRVVVTIGSTGPIQKITCQLWGGQRVLGYLKYAELPAARLRLENEYRVLSALPPGLGPEVIKYGPFGNGCALLTTPASGIRVRATLPPPASAHSFLQKLVSPQHVSLGTHPWVAERLHGDRPEHRRWLELLASRTWPIVTQHGDFAPWNLFVSLNRDLCAIDWEYGTPNGLPCLDLAYYVLQVAALIYRWRPQRALEYGTRYFTSMPELDLNRSEAHALLALAASDGYDKSREAGLESGARLQRWRMAIVESEARAPISR